MIISRSLVATDRQLYIDPAVPGELREVNLVNQPAVL